RQLRLEHLRGLLALQARQCAALRAAGPRDEPLARQLRDHRRLRRPRPLGARPGGPLPLRRQLQPADLQDPPRRPEPREEARHGPARPQPLVLRPGRRGTRLPGLARGRCLPPEVEVGRGQGAGSRSARYASIISLSVALPVCFGRQPSFFCARVVRMSTGVRTACSHDTALGSAGMRDRNSAVASSAASGTGNEYQPSTSATSPIVSGPRAARLYGPGEPRPRTPATNAEATSSSWTSWNFGPTSGI